MGQGGAQALTTSHPGTIMLSREALDSLKVVKDPKIQQGHRMRMNEIRI